MVEFWKFTFISFSITLHGYYKVWIKVQEDAGNNSFCECMNYDNWRMSWYAYLSLLDIDTSTGFSCNICGIFPKIVVCDASSLGFQKKFSGIAFPEPSIIKQSRVKRQS